VRGYVRNDVRYDVRNGDARTGHFRFLAVSHAVSHVVRIRTPFRTLLRTSFRT